VKAVKKQLIIDAVEQTNGNYVEAAVILGMHPNNLHRLIRNLGLKDAINEKLREAARLAPRARVSGGAA
jgi:DNA-binding NtrC family response regulator